MALVIEVTLGLLGDQHELGPGGAGAGARIVGRGLNMNSEQPTNIIDTTLQTCW